MFLSYSLFRVSERTEKRLRVGAAVLALPAVGPIRGAPVSAFVVGKELGHGGDALVRRVYGHMGTVRHRADVVEYRVEQHTEELGPRLRLLRSA